MGFRLQRSVKICKGVRLEKKRFMMNIHQHSEKIPDWFSIQKSVNEAVAIRYQRISFTQEEPNREILKSDIIAEANRNIRSLFGKKKKINAYVSERLDQKFSIQTNEWLSKKALHESEQDNVEIEKNKQFEKDLSVTPFD
ncbi:hypothetical protein [Oceanispirochaeta sp.]|jgi:hypothetical protein|uniref:hypothetical protein n=1 Tax=Oceanispirochaeta sp. TaxID=2035350 RepID=UPI002604975D|nr:hypothetical protein [Oceanispirochaeta sp.]MDA3957972.1 hypothetical protein [Oceanispirochaeta sp.]